MPYVTVKMLSGRTVEQKRALIEKVTEAVSETTNAPKENITVFIEEMEKQITVKLASCSQINKQQETSGRYRASLFPIYLISKEEFL